MTRKRAILISIQICLLGLLSCGPSEYKCKLDQNVISQLEKTYRLTTNTNETLLSSSRYGEQFYKIVSIHDESIEKNVPIEDLAFMYKDELYCCLSCAETAMNNKNKTIKKNREERRLIEIGDSLFMDSVKRGLR